jgi:GT2 family glycosyltransferase
MTTPKEIARMSGNEMDATNVILILNYNGGSDTIACLESLSQDSIDLASKVVVIDNGSTDSSRELIRRSFPEVKIFQNPENLGFAEGYNRAINWCIQRGTESVLLLNNDTIVRKGAYERLLMSLHEDETIGAIGPAILYPNSNIIQSLGANIRWKLGKPVLRSRGDDYDKAALVPTEVDYVSGSAMLLRCEAILKAGLFPSHFFMYGEELDLCLRICSSGFKVVCDPRAAVEHNEGSTVSRYPGLKEKYMTRNRFLIMKRHGSTLDFLVFSIWLTVIEGPITSLISISKGSSYENVLAKIVGAAEGIILALNERRMKPYELTER